MSRTRGMIPAVVATASLAMLGACTSSGPSTGAPTTGAAATSSPTTSAPAPTATTTAPVDGAVTPVPQDELDRALASVPTGALSQADADGLRWMREEEKLALDVYRALGDVWGLRTFSNIAAAEETHMAAVATLLDRYDLPDPAAGRAPGSFTDPAIQRLYDDLVARGRTSLVEALRVGAEIEELDIADLRARATATADIALVYANLEKGSRNHLRAFASQLTSRGTTYSPVHIDAAAYQSIVGSPIERGLQG